MEMVTVRPLKPFVGSYPCPMSEADAVIVVYDENDHGEIVKKRQGRKRFSGEVGYSRQLAASDLKEIDKAKAENREPQIYGAGNYVVTIDTKSNMVHFDTTKAFVDLPKDMATDLINRGLAEKAKRPRGAASVSNL